MPHDSRQENSCPAVATGVRANGRPLLVRLQVRPLGCTAPPLRRVGPLRHVLYKLTA